MRINSVQVLRAVAAILVVSGHAMATAQRIGPFDRPTIPTGAGVDLFFAISGFIMVVSSERLFAQPGARGQFLYRRITRIAPLYWLATTAYLGLLFLATRQGKAAPGLGAIVSSYLFIPNGDFQPVAGVPFPVLSLGWSLNYEMLFYVIFALFIVLARARAVAATLTVLALAAAFSVAVQPTNVVISTWTQPIILEFGIGMATALLFRHGVALPRPIRLAVIIGAIVWLAVDVEGLRLLAQTPNDFRRVIGYGLPMASILAAVVLGPDPLPARLEAPAAVLGDASYSLYLTHPFVFVVLQRVWPKIAGDHYLWAMVAIGVLLAVALSVIVNRALEKRLLARLHEGRVGTTTDDDAPMLGANL